MRTLVALLLAGCAPGIETRALRIRGSDSEVNLVQRLGELFSAEHPEVAVVVGGGGSGVGLAGLIDATVDLANSSRPVDPEERLLALRKGVDPVATIFALDALAVVVHPDNPARGIDSATLAAIYAGELHTWPGQSAPVVPYGRQSSSGTWSFFRDVVLGRDYGLEVRELGGNAQILEAVAGDPGGVGYLAVGYLHAGATGVRALTVDGVSPLDPTAITRGDYPLIRPLYQYSDGPPDGDVAAFLDFEREHPEVIAEMGFVPVAAP